MPVDRALTPTTGVISSATPVEFDMPVTDGEDGSLIIEMPDGGVMIQLGEQADEESGGEEHDANLAEFLSDTELGNIANELVADYKSDKTSRKEWEETYVKGLELLGLKIEERTQPWEGACGVFHPMLAEAVVRFQAQAIQEIFPAKGPVVTKIVGDVTRDRIKQSERVKEYLNFLITERMSWCL